MCTLVRTVCVLVRTVCTLVQTVFTLVRTVCTLVQQTWVLLVCVLGLLLPPCNEGVAVEQGIRVVGVGEEGRRIGKGPMGTLCAQGTREEYNYGAVLDIVTV